MHKIKSHLDSKFTIKPILKYLGKLAPGSTTGKPVKLDIGGTIFHTTPTTIYKYFSRLKRDFEFHREFHIKSDSIEHYSLMYRDQLFYDRDSENFRYILNFLRDGDNMKLPKNREKVEEILEEAKFWMLKELEELCSRKKM
ncbi:hypothetical protein B9Z55_007653 [Caenorhabditis nigoni]|uniref:Potassium channel tetramerisation-type BTB domain-containing protein n=1 Tax=Caenorhabditis nigoni TaxID=1611254 RepID=A0A2G5VAJ9_9PELO|nr:hypothetical protein B9Z55_007653 [Caenorhabditis nigoni]